MKNDLFQNSPAEDLNVIIDRVDISGKEKVVFSPIGGQKFSTTEPALIKIALFTEQVFKKNTFEPGEIESYYKKFTSGYKPTLPTEKAEVALNKLRSFAKSGGSFEILSSSSSDDYRYIKKSVKVKDSILGIVIGVVIMAIAWFFVLMFATFSYASALLSLIIPLIFFLLLAATSSYYAKNGRKDLARGIWIPLVVIFVCVLLFFGACVIKPSIMHY